MHYISLQILAFYSLTAPVLSNFCFFVFKTTVLLEFSLILKFFFSGSKTKKVLYCMSWLSELTIQQPLFLRSERKTTFHKTRKNGSFQDLSSIAPLEIPNSNRIKSWENCLIVDTSICIEYESPCRYVNVEFVNTPLHLYGLIKFP